MNLKKMVDDFKKDRLTIMLIPNSTSTPKTISIPTKLIYLLAGILFVSFSFSFFIITRHIDYLNTISHNIILENKLEYFSKELIKNRNFLAEVRDVDTNLRIVLGMKDKKAMLDSSSVGGPQLIDEIIARKLTQGNMAFSVDEFSLSLNIMHKEIENQVKSSKEILKYLTIQKKMENAKPNIWPTVGYISSAFGYRIHPMTGRTEYHSGIDISNHLGTTVIATADGIVKHAGWFGGYGQLVVINHGYGYSTFYGHLSKILAKPGARIKKGTKLGLIGSTGISTGPHLHYEVRYMNKPQNPLKFVYSKKK
jgi:hypothetical protein